MNSIFAKFVVVLAVFVRVWAYTDALTLYRDDRSGLDTKSAATQDFIVVTAVNKDQTPSRPAFRSNDETAETFVNAVLKFAPKFRDTALFQRVDVLLNFGVELHASKLQVRPALGLRQSRVCIQV